MQIHSTPSNIPFIQPTSLPQAVVPVIENTPYPLARSKGHPVINCSKEDLLTSLINRKMIGPDFKLILDKLIFEFPKMDYEEFKSLVDMLVQTRQIPIYKKSNEMFETVATASFSWLELFKYLKKKAPETKSFEIFGSMVPFFLPKTAEKVCQQLLQNPDYQLNPELLQTFIGNPADTDYLISILSGSLESFYDYNNVIVEFIAQKGCLNSPHVPLKTMKELVEQNSFYKRNIPTAAYADVFALFSLKEAGQNGEISEFVISQKRNEFGFFQDDISLPLNEIIEAFPESIFETTNITHEDRQSALIKAKDKLLSKAQTGSFNLAVVQSKEGNPWQIFLDLIIGNLTLPEKASEKQERWTRLIRKYALGKSSVDNSLEKMAVSVLSSCATNWPMNRFSLPAPLGKKLSQIEMEDPRRLHAERVAAIATHHLEKLFSRSDAEYNALISTLWHASASFQRNGLEDAIAPLWSSMQACIGRLQIKAKSSDQNTLWKTIAEAMNESPEDFNILATLFEVNAFISLATPSAMSSYAGFNVALTSNGRVPALKISEGKYSFTVPADPLSTCQKLSAIKDRIPSTEAFSRLNVLPTDYSTLISCLTSQITEESAFSWKLIAMEGLKAFSTPHQAGHLWNTIKASMPHLLDEIHDPLRAIKMIKSALKFHLKNESDISALFPCNSSNIPPHLLWINALLKLADNGNADMDVTRAYSLWNKYRQKNPDNRNFSFELEIIQLIASHKPYLAIPLFYTLEKSGYKTIDDQKTALTWLFSLIKKFPESQQDLHKTFSSLLTTKTQCAFYNHALQAANSSESINSNLACLFSLRKNMPSDQQNDAGPIDSMLVDFALEKIDLLHSDILANAYRVAMNARSFPQAQTMLLKMLKDKEFDSLIAAETVIAFLTSIEKEDDAAKILGHPRTEKLLEALPEKGLKALLHLQRLQSQINPISTDIKKISLKLYLNLCQSSQAGELDYYACVPLLRTCLNENLKSTSALKKCLQNCQEKLLDVALKQSNDTNTDEFCDLLFEFLNTQISSGVTTEHAVHVIEKLRSNPSDNHLAKEIGVHKRLLKSLLPAGTDLEFLSHSQHLEFKNKLAAFVREPNDNDLLELCAAAEKHPYDLEAILQTVAFLPEHRKGDALKLFNRLAIIICKNLKQIKNSPAKLKTAGNIWISCKKSLAPHLPEIYKTCLTPDDLIMAVLANQEEQISESSPFLSTDDPELLSWQAIAIKEMTNTQYAAYCKKLTLCLTKNTNIQKQESIGYQKHLQLIINTVPMERKMQLWTAIIDLNSKASIKCAFIIMDAIFKDPIPASKRKALVHIAKDLLSKAVTNFPKNTQNLVVDSLIAYQKLLEKKYSIQVYALLIRNLASKLEERSQKVAIKPVEEFVHLHIKGLAILNDAPKPFLETATLGLAKIAVNSREFPEALLTSFVSAVSKYNVSDNEVYILFLKSLPEFEILQPTTFLYTINAFYKISDLLLKKELPENILNHLVTEIINFSSMAFEDSCFNAPDKRFYEAFQMMIIALLQSQQVAQSTIHRGKCSLMMGLPYNENEWVIKSYTGSLFTPRVMQPVEVFQVIHTEIHSLMRNVILPSKSTKPTGYVSFQYLSQLLLNAYKQEIFKNRHAQYLMFVSNVISIYIAYIDNEGIFDQMTDTLCDLLCAGNDTLDAEDESIRAHTMWLLQQGLATLQNPIANKALEKILAEAIKRKVRISQNIMPTQGRSLLKK